MTIRSSADAAGPAFVLRMALGTLVILGTAAGAAEVDPNLGTPEAAQREEREEREEREQLHMRDGQLEGEVVDMRLDRLTLRLTELTNIIFVVPDRSLVATRVTAKVRLQSVDRALKLLLDGYSYAIMTNVDSGQRRVIVNASHTGRAPVVASVNDGAPVRDPQVAPQAVLAAPSAIDRDAEGDEYADDFDTEDAHDYERVLEQDLEEERLERALLAVESGDAVSRITAIEVLTGLPDPRAALAIARLATDRDQTADDRLVATVALANHAADLQFEDEGAMRALETLAADEDMAVAEVAQRAIDQQGARQ